MNKFNIKLVLYVITVAHDELLYIIIYIILYTANASYKQYNIIILILYNNYT